MTKKSYLKNYNCFWGVVKYLYFPYSPNIVAPLYHEFFSLSEPKSAELKVANLLVDYLLIIHLGYYLFLINIKDCISWGTKKVELAMLYG